MLHVAARPVPGARLGIALTRRGIPSAVERNRMKRALREAFRRHALKASGVDCVVTLRGRMQPAQRELAVAEIRALFDQALRQVR